MKYNSESLLTNFKPEGGDLSDHSQVQDFICSSDIQLGFLPKKGNASVKSMLKVYKLEDQYSSHMSYGGAKTEKLISCEGAQIKGINTIAYLSRLELYVAEHQWLKASMEQRAALTVFIECLEDRMSEVLLEWNR